MSTITDLPYELLYHIIFLLVQSSISAADFANIISVCRKFLLLAEEEHILKLVNFDINMKLDKIYQYQHVNGLLVKCSEAGNVAARFLLGKVILVSSSQLFLKEWQKAECDVHPCDQTTLRDLQSILVTNVHAQNCRVDSFMTYFSPEEALTSVSSRTRLVHCQLVKMFLVNGSSQDLAEMSAFVKSYIRYFTNHTKEDSPLIRSINNSIFCADTIRHYENVLMEVQANYDDVVYEGLLSYLSQNLEAEYDVLTILRVHTLRLFKVILG